GNPLAGSLTGILCQVCSAPGGAPACFANPAYTPTLSGLAQSVMRGNGRYSLQYPAAIQLYGLSFSTTLPTGTAWSGAISYRP
ncbi:DUF1302 family protein, partial [Stutzerimonas stutzeri]|uniref:DUF1302 family protein n=1 Tax=Stutzerimonas stutzeri TaxID=316 RepID=UPI0024B7F77B